MVNWTATVRPFENLMNLGDRILEALAGLLQSFTIAAETPQNAVALTVSGGATPTNTSAAVDVGDAKTLTLQVRNGASTSLTATVLASPDDSVYDDQAYGSLVLGANQEKSVPVTPGPRYVKVYVANGDAANATVVTTKLTVRK